MKNKNLSIIALLSSTMLFITACTKDLNRSPLNSNTSETQYSTVGGYQEVLAKVYGAYSLASSSGTGVSDVNIAGALLILQQLILSALTGTCTERTTGWRSMCTWNDPNLQSFLLI